MKHSYNDKRKIFILLTIIVLFVVSCKNKNFSKANSVSINNISNIKTINEYNDDVLADDFDTVIFGQYPQSRLDEKSLESIPWIVLERNDNKALLISKYILECKSYNENYVDVDWKNSTIRNWLNNEFYNIAFNDDEKQKIQESVVSNMIDGLIDEDNNTIDKVFLLSVDEAIKYFYKNSLQDENKKAVAKPTEYSKRNLGAMRMMIEGLPKDFWFSEYSLWWLRTEGEDKSSAANIRNNGYLRVSGDRVHNFAVGVRPVIWITYD